MTLFAFYALNNMHSKSDHFFSLKEDFYFLWKNIVDFWGRRRKLENLGNSIVSFAFSFRHCTMYRVWIIEWSGKGFEDIPYVYYTWHESLPFFLDISWHISYSLGRITNVAFGGLMFPQRRSDVCCICFHACDFVLNSWVLSEVVSCGEIVDTECWVCTNYSSWVIHFIWLTMPWGSYYYYHSTVRDTATEARLSDLSVVVWAEGGGATVHQVTLWMILTVFKKVSWWRWYFKWGNTHPERDSWPSL